MSFSVHPVFGPRPEVFEKFIRPYDGATLMSLRLSPNIDYINSYYFTRSAKEYVRQMKPEVADRIEKWPVERIAGVPVEAVPPEILPQNIMKFMFYSIWRNSASIPFRHPVSPEAAPDYANIVKVPIDLSEIEEKLDDEEYTIEDFLNDLKLLFANCYQFNGCDSPYSRRVKVIEDQVKAMCEKANIPFNVKG
jgi:histone acetyltransferase